MKYEYKKLDIDSYIDSLYLEGFKKSNIHNDEELKKIILNIGIFKFKGYSKAFRKEVLTESIDDILNLYYADRSVSSKLFELSSKIEIKLKSYLIEIVYELTENPFFYLIKESYIEDYKISNESIYDWEVKEVKRKQKSEIYLHYRDYYLDKYDFESNKTEYLSGKNIIQLNKELDINYPPFHYFIENITLGALINMISKLTIDGNNILKLLANKFNMYDTDVFLTYLLRLKEVRNRCAHNGRLFNRNYRGVKAFGKHKNFRKTIYEHKLIDVYYSLHLLLNEKQFNDINELNQSFKDEVFVNCDKKIEEFMIKILRTG